MEDVFRYLINLTSNSIKIPFEKYFLAQKKYEKIPVIRKNIAYLLYFLAKIKTPQSVFEIGFGSGYSAISILTGIFGYEAILNFKGFQNNYKNSVSERENHHKEDKESGFKFITLEREKKRFSRGVRLIKRFNLPVELLNVDFFDFIETIKKNELKFDFVFVDSVKRRYIEIFNLLKPHIVQGGIIIFDNILFGGKVVSLKQNEVRKYLAGSRLLNRFNIKASLDKDFDFIFLNIDDGIAIGIKK